MSTMPALAMSTPGAYADLPKVVAIIGKSDAGEFGAATCPHCGAEGRYIYHFMCADGTTRGAMAGCFKHFPKHQFVTIHQRILDKQQDYARKGWNLPSWDTDILNAIQAFGSGTISEQQTNDIIRSASMRSANYRKNRFGRRH